LYEAAMAQLNISVPEGLKQWADQRVAEGRYSSTSDLVRDLMRRRQEEEAQLAALQAAIDKGRASPALPGTHSEIIAGAEARADMVDVYARGIDRFGPEAATAYIEGIDRALSRLAEFPLIGPAFPGLRMPVRYLAFRSHHIFYDFDGTTVWVVRILHHAQDAGRLI
jgi:antitoxin ParD1/3/4